LVRLRSGTSSIKSSDIVLIIHGLDRHVILADLVDGGWRLHLALLLGSGGAHVHLFDRHGFQILLCYDCSEFRHQYGLEQIHFEEVEHHGRVLPFECPESLVGDAVVDVVVRIRGDGSVVHKAFFNDSDRPGDSGKQLICHLVRLHGQVS